MGQRGGVHAHSYQGRDFPCCYDYPVMTSPLQVYYEQAITEAIKEVKVELPLRELLTMKG